MDIIMKQLTYLKPQGLVITNHTNNRVGECE